MADESNDNTTTDALAALYGPGRDPQTGRFTKDHTFSVQHGMFSSRDLLRLQDDIEVPLSAAVSDEGGDVPVRKRQLLEARMRLWRRFVQADNLLELRGVTDGKGRLRLAHLQRLEGLAASILAYDRLLGLARKPRDANTLESYIAEKYGHRATATAAPTTDERPDAR
jgi:hypothetical protein